MSYMSSRRARVSESAWERAGTFIISATPPPPKKKTHTHPCVVHISEHERAARRWGRDTRRGGQRDKWGAETPGTYVPC